MANAGRFKDGGQKKKGKASEKEEKEQSEKTNKE